MSAQDPRHMWSAEELQQLLDELVGGQDPAVVASSVSSALRVPIPECERLIDMLRTAFIKWSDTEQERGNRRKRFRRKAAAIERSWFCYVPGCPKSYGTENALKNHFKHKHKTVRFDKAIAHKMTASVERSDRNDSSELADSVAAESEDEDERSVPPRPSKLRKVPDEPLRLYGYPQVAAPAHPNWVPIPHMHMTQIGQPFYGGLQAFPLELSSGSWPRAWADPSLLHSDATPPQQKLPAIPSIVAPSTVLNPNSSPQPDADSNFRAPESSMKAEYPVQEASQKERSRRRGAPRK